MMGEGSAWLRIVNNVLGGKSWVWSRKERANEMSC